MLNRSVYKGSRPGRGSVAEAEHQAATPAQPRRVPRETSPTHTLSPELANYEVWTWVSLVIVSIR